MYRWCTRRVASVAGSLFIANWCGFASAQSLDPDGGAVSQAVAPRCGSIVAVHCTEQATRAAPGVRHSDDELKGLQGKFEQRRLGGYDVDDLLAEDAIVVSADPIYDPSSNIWEQFADSFESAKVPACLHAGERAGLLAAILVPMMATNGNCR